MGVRVGLMGHSSAKKQRLWVQYVLMLLGFNILYE